MKYDEIISTLNDLIQTCKDGENGFINCAENASDSKLKLFFSARAESCVHAARQLQELVRARGGDPETKGSLSGALHRQWLDIKAAIIGKNDEAILNECERGEDVAVHSYQRALEKDLPPEVEAIIEQQYRGALKNHDQVKILRNQARISSSP